MRCQWFALALGCLVAGCTFQQGNGGEGHFFSNSGLFVDQSWEIAQKEALPGGDRVCMVSAGGLDVTLRAHEGKVNAQVGPDEPLDPGYRFTVLVNGHNYETTNDWFDPDDSRAIAADFLKAPVVYTERLEIEVGGRGSIWRHFNNTIQLDTFPSQYRVCREFVANHSAHR